jgi:hypothetical protein
MGVDEVVRIGISFDDIRGTQMCVYERVVMLDTLELEL